MRIKKNVDFCHLKYFRIPTNTKNSVLCDFLLLIKVYISIFQVSMVVVDEQDVREQFKKTFPNH